MTTTLNPSNYAQRVYNMTQPIDFEVAVAYATAVFAIAGADGELAQAELDWFLDEQRLLLGSEEAERYVEAVRAIDWKHTQLSESLSKISYDFPLNFRRAMLYQAIKMSSADGEYHDLERAATRKAGEALEISPEAVAQLEVLVELEASAGRLRDTLFRS